MAPWITAWLVSLVGTYTSLPPLLPSDAQPNALILNDIPLHASTPVDGVIDIDEPVEVNLVIQNKCVNADGFPRVAVLAGIEGEEPTLPGPVISGQIGQEFVVNVENDLKYHSMLTGTSIHWHGIHQIKKMEKTDDNTRGTIEMDGTPGLTQCAIGPGHTFQYKFTPDQAGTFWYHSHYGPQYCDGLRGPLIVYDDSDREREDWGGYEEEDGSTIITLMDWYHYPSVVTPRQIWPDSVLINGVGCYQAGENCPELHRFKVTMGKKYRFRLLNMACKSFYDFSIAGHKLIVIEVEGTIVKPYTVDSIRIYAAQRYSFILEANQKQCIYNVNAKIDPGENNTSIQFARLEYEGATEYCSPPSPQNPIHLNEACLDSVEPFNTHGYPEEPINLAMTKNADMNFLVNGAEYESPSIPIMLQIMNGWLPDQLEPQRSIMRLDTNKTVVVTFDIESAGRPHPFHLHGHSFEVVKSADGECGTPPQNPIVRDTVDTGFVGTNGVTIRFVTDNPGVWFLHCHNDWHLWTGMALVFAEGCTTDDCEEILNYQEPYGDGSKELCNYTPTDYFPLPPPNEFPGRYRGPMEQWRCVPEM